ncbi:hypothetical protein C8Q76DRAFT_132054 [Earliella scabrosa]|nr:hypothetical protein C8Q76DRAFT_132054 [Earliella scabrosa]
MVKYPSWSFRSIAWSRPLGTLVTVVAFAQAMWIVDWPSWGISLFMYTCVPCDSCNHVWVDAIPNTVQSGVLYSERSFRGQGLLLPSGAYPYIVDVAEGPFPACNGRLTCPGFSSSTRILLSRSAVEMYRMVVMPSRDDCLGFWS